MMPSTPPIGGAPSKPVFQKTTGDVSRNMIVFLGIVTILFFGREVLVPITLAFVLAFLLAPLVTLLRKLRLGRVPSVMMAVITALVVLVALGGAVGSQIADLTTGLPGYVTHVKTKISDLETSTTGRVSHLFAGFGVKAGVPTASPPAVQKPPAQVPAAPPGAAQHHPSAAPAPPAAAAPAPPPAPPQAAASPAQTPQAMMADYLGPALAPFETLGIVIVITIFALLQREDLRDRLIRLIGSGDIHRTTLALDEAGRRLSRYFLTQFAINSFFGIVIAVGLYFIGVPKPILWGLLSAILRFIPYVGSFVSALLPVALAAAVEPGWSMAIWTAGFFIGAELLTGQAIEPLLYGHSTGLSPFSVIVAAIFWSWLWGPVGLILSTPLTLCLVVAGRHVRRLQFLDVMLGDRAALTPVETLYQRILADDPDEALAQAETYLKQEPLCGYYDTVMLKAMQMSAYDAERGSLDSTQIAAVGHTIQVVVSHLEGASTPAMENAVTDNDDLGDGVLAGPRRPDLPPDWQADGAILSIAGRGPLDSPAATMLGQVLKLETFGFRVVAHNEVSRDAIATFNPKDAKIACIAYLDIAASHAQLHFLVQRLRGKLTSGTPIIVGLWPIEDTVLESESTRRSIGADYFASSFQDILNTCRFYVQNKKLPPTNQPDTYDGNAQNIESLQRRP